MEKHDVYQQISELGLKLPKAPPLGGIYTPIKRHGNLLFTAGQGATKDGVPYISGKAGVDVDIETAQEAARGAVMNMLSALHEYLGDLNKISNVVKILGFVASGPEFYDQPKVMNGASELIGQIFGQKGEHARSAIGTNVLPGNLTVEIEGIFEVED